MEEVFARAEELISDVKKYVDNRVTSAKLNTAEKVSEVGSKIIAVVVVAVVFIFFILFASITLAYILSKWTGEYYVGFSIVTGLYLLLGIIILITREKIIRLPLLNALINQLFKKDEEN